MPALRSHGDVRVVSRVVGFKKIKFYTNENVGSGELDLPEQQMHTTAYWLTLPRALMVTLPYSLEDRRDGVAGLAFAMVQVAQLLLMCDRRDLGLSIGSGDEGSAGDPALATQDLEEPRIFVYDNYPGGIGFSEPLFGMHDALVAETRKLIAGCECDHGCPTCVGPVGETGPGGQAGCAADSRSASRSSTRMSAHLESRLRDILRDQRRRQRDVARARAQSRPTSTRFPRHRSATALRHAAAETLDGDVIDRGERPVRRDRSLLSGRPLARHGPHRRRPRPVALDMRRS